MSWKWHPIVKIHHDCILVKLLNVKTNEYAKYLDIKENYSNIKFINYFIKLFMELDYFDEFYIEFNPIIFNLIDNIEFEFVLIKTSGFASEPDMNSFGVDNLNTNSNDIIWFPNPSNTALLIVPCFNHGHPMEEYIHIGKFIKSSNICQKQKQNLIIKMFELYFELGKKDPGKKLWLSTHGKGVGWLHIRIDKIPRYITWNPYK